MSDIDFSDITDPAYRQPGYAGDPPVVLDPDDDVPDVLTPAEAASTAARMASDDEDDRDDARAEGREAGVRWARDHARPRQLRRLDYFDDVSVEPELPGRVHLDFWLYRLIHADGGDEQGRREFWETVLGRWKAPDLNDHDFVKAFIRGALAVWHETMFSF